jgi:hypothetical protein
MNEGNLRIFEDSVVAGLIGNSLNRPKKMMEDSIHVSSEYKYARRQ